MDHAYNNQQVCHCSDNYEESQLYLHLPLGIIPRSNMHYMPSLLSEGTISIKKPGSDIAISKRNMDN
jgi:hypothetical protein